MYIQCMYISASSATQRLQLAFRSTTLLDSLVTALARFFFFFLFFCRECSMKLMYTAIDPAAALLLLLAPISFSNRWHSRRAALTVGKTRHYILIGPSPGKSRLGVAGAQ
jgi:hypothetical protein